MNEGMIYLKTRVNPSNILAVSKLWNMDFHIFHANVTEILSKHNSTGSQEEHGKKGTVLHDLAKAFHSGQCASGSVRQHGNHSNALCIPEVYRILF